MDIKKDIETAAVNQGSSSGIQKGRALVSSTSMESFSISLGKRSERLATALYLVTNFLSDNEPLKSRLRTLSLDLVRDASSVRYGSVSVESHTLDILRANIGETLGLLELAFIAGLVSEMNFSVLKREYGMLRDAIEIKKASRESRTDSVLGDTFFGSPFTERPILEATKKFTAGSIVTRDNSIGQHKGQNNTMMSDSVSDKKTTITSVKTKSEDRPLGVGSQVPNSVQKDSRRACILKLIKDNREVTIKDISTHFPEYSEKTIQRELVSLTTDGVLKKYGERRWSRYALA